ncbi:MAG TPA: hypothetical protein O0X23_00645 [Methanocorpusculum sp.]|nr:hypothetical protein [Methanocorpusculum sp.]
MKTLPLNRRPNGKATVLCQDKEVSVHSSCAFCAYCAGIRVNRRVTPNPYAQALHGSKGGLSLDQQLMEGLMQFNTVIEDANATDIECSDDAGCGFVTLTRRR